MLTLVLLGLAGGLIAGISPCVLPVLPALMLGSGLRADGQPPGRRRPLMIVAGLALSFAVFTLLGTALVTALGLPAQLLRWAGIAALALIGAGLVVPSLGRILERPFARVPGARRGGDGSGFVLGLSLGTLYIPCAGPVLAAIAISGSTGRIDGYILVLTVAFAVGTAVPLLAFAMAGQGIGRRLSAYRARARRWQVAGGMVMVLLAAALAFNLTDPLQRTIPGYTQALQDAVENGPEAQAALDSAAGRGAPTVTSRTAPPATTQSIKPATSAPARAAAAPAAGPVVACRAGASDLANCGAAAEFSSISGWLNTDTGTPPTLTSLRGSVVLVDFWAFSCINCQRTTPFLTAWYQRYHAVGLEIIGVHTPEFAFERDRANLAAAVAAADIPYPVAMDNDSATWSAYRNSYWPAEYLVDSSGVLRHTQFGEGGYNTSESLIRDLLRAARPGVVLPAPIDPGVPA